MVPSTLSPPTIPRRGLAVFVANSSPPGMATVTHTSAGTPYSPATSRNAPSIISRGRGLIAGSPGGTGSPGRVTVPTPSPAAKRTPEPAGPHITVQRMRAPWVTSGSSPASLMTAAVALSPARSCSARAKSARKPRGRRIVTGSGNPPPSRASNAAFAAAVAHAPVVQPRRKPAPPRWVTVSCSSLVCCASGIVPSCRIMF